MGTWINSGASVQYLQHVAENFVLLLFILHIIIPWTSWSLPPGKQGDLAALRSELRLVIHPTTIMAILGFELITHCGQIMYSNH